MRDPRDKVVLTSLQEDFKAIGIIAESEEVEVEETEEDAELEEGRRRAAGGRKMVRTKKMKSGDKAKARASYRRRKGKIAKRRKKLSKTSRGKKLAKLAMAMSHKESVQVSSSDRINSILEDVKDIVSSVNESDSSQDLDNAIKSFANVAIISEMLANFFAESVELVESNEELSSELTDAAEYFQEQAEQAAYLATLLDEGGELDEDVDVDALFQEHMNALVEGLELYADLTEDEDEDDEDEDDDSDLEEDEDEDELEEMSAVDRMRALMSGND